MTDITIDLHNNPALTAEALRLGLHERSRLQYDVRIRPATSTSNKVTISAYDNNGLLCQTEQEVPVFTDAEIAEAITEMVRHRRVGKEAVMNAVGAV